VNEPMGAGLCSGWVLEWLVLMNSFITSQG
jgi:hypothetical protein